MKSLSHCRPEEESKQEHEESSEEEAEPNDETTTPKMELTEEEKLAKRAERRRKHMKKQKALSKQLANTKKGQGELKMYKGMSLKRMEAFGLHTEVKKIKRIHEKLKKAGKPTGLASFKGSKPKKKAKE